MASLIYLDTHAVVWLYLGRLDRFPGAAQAAINENDLRIDLGVAQAPNKRRSEPAAGDKW